MSPLISIITVSFNAQETIPATLKSVEEQTFRNFEYLVIDGASKDGTLDLLRNVSVEKCRIVSEPDKGIYDAMNKGMKLAKGQYYIFLNAGDSFHSSETLKEIADAIIKNDYPGVVYGQTQLVDGERCRIADRHLTAPAQLTYKSFAKGMLVCHQAFVAKASIAPMYDLAYRFSADYDWCIKCLKASTSNVYIPGIMIDYLDEGMTTRNRKASLKERFKIMCHYYGTIPTVMRHIAFIPRFLCHRKQLKDVKKVEI